MSMPVKPSRERVERPNGTLVSWTLRANERGDATEVHCGNPIAVQVSGRLYGGSVSFMGALDQELPLVPLLDARGDLIAIAETGILPLPSQPVVLAPVCNDLAADAEVTVSIFLGD